MMVVIWRIASFDKGSIGLILNHGRWKWVIAPSMGLKVLEMRAHRLAGIHSHKYMAYVGQAAEKIIWHDITLFQLMVTIR